ncbi:MAG: guanylate kinase [Chloroflexota bacterium]|nr:guanylate kinase [Chloroflexota bacterium]
MNARLSDMRTLEAELSVRFDHGDRHIERLRNTAAPRVFIISGPSGVGKDTVLEQLRLTYPDAVYVVTATSRPKRPGEIEGVHYHFIEREDFEQQVANGEFIENAVVYNNLYGVPRTPIVDGLAAGKDVIIKVDVKGAATLRQKISNTVSIFLAPESMRELLNRLRLRKTDDYDALKRRFTTASDELERVEEFDYVVFNESEALDAAVHRITNIIEAEKARVTPPEVTVQ